MIAHDLTVEELGWLARRAHKGRIGYKWLRLGDGTVHNPCITFDSGVIVTALARSAYPSAAPMVVDQSEAIVRAIYDAERDRYERASKAAKKAGETRARRRAAQVYAVVRRLRANEALQVRRNCIICGRAVDDPDSVARGMRWVILTVGWCTSALRSVAAAVEDGLAGARERRMRRRLSASSDFRFDADHTSAHESVWAQHLADFVGQADLQLLEVGVFQGLSTLWFLQNVLTHPTAKVTCIDSFGRVGGEPHFDHNMRVSGFADKVSKLKGLSVDVLPTLSRDSYDIIYVDGSHRAVDVLMDAFLCWSLLKRGGVMIFDDYMWEPERPRSLRPHMSIDLFLEAVGDAARVMHQD